MANFRGESGVDVTDEMLDKWESDAKKGIYHGKAGNLHIKKPLGRPPLYEEAMLPITFRVSAEDAAALKASADKQGVKVGDVVREACKLLLAQHAL